MPRLYKICGQLDGACTVSTICAIGVETRLIASVQFIASVAKIVGYHHHGMVLKNISFLFAFSQNEHTFITVHFGSNCAQ